MMTARGERRRLPVDRESLVHDFNIGGLSGTVIVGLYEDGTPGEIFLRVHRMGSFANGMCNAFAIAVSSGLQHGVPLSSLIRSMSHMKFAPGAWTGDPKLGYAGSLVDYLMRWLAARFPERGESEGGAPMQVAGSGASVYRVFFVHPSEVWKLNVLPASADVVVDLQRRDYDFVCEASGDGPMEVWRKLHDIPGLVSERPEGVREVQVGDVLERPDGTLVMFAVGDPGYVTGKWVE